MNEETEEELQALLAIYEDDLTEISRQPPCFMVRLPEIESLSDRLQIKLTLPADYPSSVPTIEVPMRSHILSAEQCAALISHLNTVAAENLGMAMVFTLVDEATQWLSENVHQSPAEINTIEQQVPVNVPAVSPVKLEEPKTTGGRWEYVIGLVGKPSAGKSTFFNACTSVDLAKTGAHPFTTIEPNIGKAFYSIPCPCAARDKLCDAEHGHTHCEERHVPVLLKDVAGLVPGAWEGKGRGNRFLHDLLDADALIHIIDISGRTNEKGEETTEYDPANDVRWLRNELHQWIYQNVHEKWDNIVKRPDKLVAMFTGYHANKATIHAALRNAGIGEKELGDLRNWGEEVLHRIVDNFLDLRFPMLLVLNKADVKGVEENIERLETEFPNYSCIAVSARCECALQQLAKQEVIQYERGQGQFKVNNQSLPGQQAQLQELEAVLQKYGSTNVHKALCEAVSLRSPVYAFPVSDLDSWRSVRKGQSQSHLETTVLRDCVSLRPGSTVENLYTVMSHYPVQLLTGDFVRAETFDLETNKKRPLKKDEVITPSNCILHIMTNRKSS